MRRFIWLAVTCVLTVHAQSLSENKPAYGPVKSMSPAEFEREMAQSKHYDFELASPDGLVDAQGTHIQAADLMAYLREKQIDVGAYFLLSITNQSPPLNSVAVTVAPLGRYGLTKIVFRNKPGGAPIPIVAEYHPAPGSPPAENPVRVISIRPNSNALTAGLPFPDLSGRPVSLRPGVLPPRVRYAFAPDEGVIAAARLAADHLLSGHPSNAPLFARNLNIQPGAWSQLKGQEGLGRKAASPWTAVVPGLKIRLEGVVLGDPGEMANLEAILVRMIDKDGGGEIRAASTAEMARWWPFVASDYTEPLLILATKNGAHTFGMLFESGRLVLIDDLNGLPSVR
jgi:hypothetical protein